MLGIESAGDAGAEHDRILECLRGALADVRLHRVRSVAEKRHTASTTAGDATWCGRTPAPGWGDVGQSRQSPLNLNSLLAAVEAAPPVAAVDVLAAALAGAIGAREVSFLIADFSGLERAIPVQIRFNPRRALALFSRVRLLAIVLEIVLSQPAENRGLASANLSCARALFGELDAFVADAAPSRPVTRSPDVDACPQKHPLGWAESGARE